MDRINVGCVKDCCSVNYIPEIQQNYAAVIIGEPRLITAIQHLRENE